MATPYSLAWLHVLKAHEEGMTEKILADHKKHKFLFPPKLTSGSRGKGAAALTRTRTRTLT